MNESHKYMYDGPVKLFDRCIDLRWTGETMATSESKARSSLTYQYKTTHNYVSGSKITLSGKITQVS